MKPALSDLLERLTLGVSKSLEKRPGVCDVKLTGGEPAERHQLVGWEQRNGCTLPDDLKNFYLTTDGVLLTWSAFTEGSKFPVGRMEINPFSRLVKIGGTTGSTAYPANIPSIADVEAVFPSDDDNDSSDEDDATPKKNRNNGPRFDNRSRIFELDPCQGYGKVCLVYLDTSPGLPAQKPEIWLLDRSLQWHFLSEDFTSYYRVMLMHLGLPEWHYALTNLGLSSQAKQWFNLYAPIRIKLDDDISEKLDSTVLTHTRRPCETLKIDFVKLFRGRASDRVKPKPSPAAQSQIRRKGNLSNANPAASTKSNISRGRSISKPWT